MTTSRILILVGIAIVLIGLLWPWLSRLGLGRLPGDIVVQRQGFSFYFPIVTCLIISVVASLLFWLFRPLERIVQPERWQADAHLRAIVGHVPGTSWRTKRHNPAHISTSPARA